MSCWMMKILTTVVNFKGLNLLIRGTIQNSLSYHCDSKTAPDRVFMHEDNVDEFNFRKKNCLPCEAIHSPQSCTVAKEYLEDLRIKAANELHYKHID